MSNPVIEHYRNAVAMVTAPEAFLELTTIEHGGQTLKAYKHAPGSMRDLWMLGQGYADQEYIVYGDERWTFAEAGQLVANFATWLQGQGLGRATGLPSLCAIIPNGFLPIGASSQSAGLSWA